MKNLHFRLFLFIIILGPSTPYGRDERDIQSEEWMADGPRNP